MKNAIRVAAPIFVLAASILLAYGGSLAGGFVWDDHFFLQDIQRTQSIREAIDFALQPLLVSNTYVRPLPLLAFYADYAAFGAEPAGWHAATLLLHFLNSSLVFLIARSAAAHSGRAGNAATSFSAACALLFALHPALTENVLWVSSRFDLLATLFMLAAIQCSSVLRGEWKRAASVALCFLFAALSKESAAIFPLVLVCVLIMRMPTDTAAANIVRHLLTRANVRMFALMAIAGALYLSIRYYSLTAYSKPGVPQSEVTLSLTDMLIRSSTALAGYIKLTLVPFVGNALHHPFSYSPNEVLQGHLPEVLLSILVISLVIALLVRRRTLGWVVVSWLIAYLPVLHLLQIPIGESVLQQRFMYLPTALLAALIPYGLSHIQLDARSAKRAIAIITAVLIVCAVSIRSVVPMWNNDLALWSWARAVTPGSGHILSQLAHAYLVRGMHDEIDSLSNELFVAGATTDPMVPAFVGMSHYARGDYEAARYFLDMANRSGTYRVNNRQISNVRSITALTHARLGDRDNARRYIHMSVEADPTNYQALGVLMAACGGQASISTLFKAEDLRDAAEFERATYHELRHAPPPSVPISDLCPDPYVAGTVQGQARRRDVGT